MCNFSLFLLIIGLICALPVQGTAEVPVHTTVLVRGAQPVIVDGDLFDWVGIGGTSQTLTTPMRAGSWLREDFFGKKTFQGPEDLSASFRAFADQDYLYIAIQVKDDQLIFGESETFGAGWRDDMVHIYLDGDLANTGNGYDANDSMIDITKNRDGLIILEGHLPFNGTTVQVPYLWNAVGVQAAIKEQKGGYSVEVLVPKSVLGLDAFRVSTKIGLNIAVSDDDDGGERDNKLGWAKDSRNWGHRTTAAIGHLVLDSEQIFLQTSHVEGRRVEDNIDAKRLRHPAEKSPPVSESLGQFQAIVQEQKEKGLTITLTDRELARRQIAFQELRNGNMETAQQRLDEIRVEDSESKNVIWAAGMLSALAEQEKKYNEAIHALYEVGRIARDQNVINWNVQRRLSLGASRARQIESTQGINAAIAKWNQIRQSAMNVSDGISLQSINSLVRLYDLRGDQRKANNLRREAIDFCTNLIQRDTGLGLRHDALFTRLKYRLKLGEDALGEQEIDRHLESIAGRPKEMALILSEVGSFFRSAGKHEKAILIHKRALEYAPNIEVDGIDIGATGRAYYELGLSYVDARKYSQARTIFEELKQSHQDPNTLSWTEYALAFMEVQERKYASALVRCQAVMVMNYTEEKLQAYNLLLMGRIYFFRGEDEQAEKVLKRVVDRYERFREPHEMSKVLLRAIRQRSW